MINSLGIIKEFTTFGVLIDSIAKILSGGWGLTYGVGHLWASNPTEDKIYEVNLPPLTFALVSPPDSALILTDTINLDWEDSYDSDSVLYCLYLSPDSTFTETLTTIMVDSLVESEYVGMELTADTIYYWKVKAYDKWGAERWSNQMWNFSLRTCACGDYNCDGRISGADATYLLMYIYREGPAPLGPGDVNGDGRITGADATYLLMYIYRGGPEPCGNFGVNPQKISIKKSSSLSNSFSVSKLLFTLIKKSTLLSLSSFLSAYLYAL